MGSVGALCPPQPPLPRRWLQAPLYPMPCIKVELVVHRGRRDGQWLFGLEASDPHTRELVGSVLDPSRRPQHPAMIVESILDELRDALTGLFDPEPFPPAD